ncbi:ABC transporter substrate-binding protein [Niastella yeongjuensis]|uniref:ABC transporter substrate-binding protein n=1 Tax=Niastella yeongjuensis TaxID=354355 RepID=A0A1V9E141_9BACT|nr:ABC transporter substrate-binding protein [Niastella yeongjuensis]OQP39781.1 ABC transporter substrate-binding protein [Niastella yeongjuensis]SEO05117.1 peptide/nickel transport system substrate-binding protein [Niastella yeongjuensis]
MKAKVIFFAVFFGVILFNSCGSRTSGNKQVFHYNETTGIPTLDPAFAKNQAIIWAVHQLYNTLVETNDALKIVPSLAYRWEVSADRKVYTFHLRPGVFFHDNDAFPGGKGRPLTAFDVAYSFSRIIDPATASSGAWIFNDRVKDKDSFKALNDSTFQLTLKSPFAPILGLLSMQYCSIVPREVVTRYGADFRSHPCGTGPFQFKAWEEGQAMILQKNDHYFEHDSAGRPLPYLDGIKITFLDSRATEFLLFQQGELDFINDIDPSFKDEILTKKGQLRQDWQGKIILSKHSYLNTEYLGILMDKNNPLVTGSPLRMKAVRQAINYGFDRRKMIMYLYNSKGMPAESGFIPAGLPSFDSSVVKGYSYNPVKARELLQSAGFPDGEGLPVIKLLTIPIYSDIAGFIARQLEEVGIKIQIEVIPKSLLLEQTAKSQALFFRGSWIADFPEAENYLSVFYGSNPAPPNYTRYNNPKFDALYDQAMVTENDSLRYKLYQQMDQLVIDDAPVVPLFYDEVVRLVQPKVKHFAPDGLNQLELRRTYFEK